MALDPNNLVTTGVTFPEEKRVVADVIQPKTFGNVSGGPTLAVLTPVSYNTSTNEWVVWDADGTNGTSEIQGFVYPDVVKLHETNEVTGNVMLSGLLHFDDIVVPTGEASADLEANVKANARDKGFTVQGLINVR